MPFTLRAIALVEQGCPNHIAYCRALLERVGSVFIASCVRLSARCRRRGNPTKEDNMNDKESLPVLKHADEIKRAVRENPVVIIQAETGAGKSTWVPQYLLQEGRNLVVTQPRRLSTRTVAARVAALLGEELGQTIGYRTAEDRKDSRQTRCLFATDGLAMIRQLMGTGRHDTLVLDEVHEWNINLEVLVAWAKRELSRGASFKVVLMSATLEAERLAGFFGGAPIIQVPGRLFPIEERRARVELVDDVADLLREGRNVLVFQPGKTEIGDTIKNLQELCVNAEILPLHGEQEPSEQALCFREYKRPKCVVATNVAQTSVTISDIDAVVDSGMERRVEVLSGVEGLYLRPISHADHVQRKGRSGRCRPGIYVDHCPEPDDERSAFPVAEIKRSRLDQTVLRLAEHGIDAEELEFFHQPAKSEIHEAKRALKALGCLDGTGNVTAIGHRIAQMPVSVQFGRMVIEAERLRVVDQVLTAAAILEHGEVTDRSGLWRALVADECESDVLAQLAVYEAARNLNKEEMRKNGVHVQSYFKVQQLRRQLAESLRGKVKFASDGTKKDVLRAVTAGMVDHLYQWRAGRYYNGADDYRDLARETVVHCAEWIVGLPWDLQVKVRFGTRTLNLVRMVTRVDPDWLMEVAPHLVSRSEGGVPRFCPEKDCVVVEVDVHFNRLMLAQAEREVPDHPAAAAVFAGWCVERMTGEGHQEGISPELDLIFFRNRLQRQRATQLNERAGRNVLPCPDVRELLDWVTERLGGARCVKEIKNLQSLQLPPLDETLCARIMRDCPYSMEIAGHSMEVKYDGKQPYLLLDVDNFLAGDEWAKLPDDAVHLPDGRSVAYAAQLSLFGQPAVFPDALKLKATLADRYCQRSWDAWISRIKPALPMPDPMDPNCTVGEIVEHVYGEHPLTGEPLIAYGTLVESRFRSPADPHFEARWVRTRYEAQLLRESAAKHLRVLQDEREALPRMPPRLGGIAGSSYAGFFRSPAALPKPPVVRRGGI